MDQYSLLTHSANDEILATKITYALTKYSALLEPDDKSLMWRWSSIIKGICEPYPITISYHIPLQHVMDLFQFDLGIKIVHISEDEICTIFIPRYLRRRAFLPLQDYCP